MKKNKKIFIATGIYPPEVGGPAEYAKNLKDVWTRNGYYVSLGIFSKYNFLPAGLRHFIYLIFISPKIIRSDYIFVSDTFSAAFPAILISFIFRKKTILRMGGDFLWESYVERTGRAVLLKDFYNTEIKKFSLKEKVIFKSIKWMFYKVNIIVWSTEWQRNIFIEPYDLKHKKHKIVENYYGKKEKSLEYIIKNFIAGARGRTIKNIESLKDIWSNLKQKYDIFLDIEKVPHNLFLEKIKGCYAVILVSLGDISPNVILDAIRFNKPFILTKETGLYDRLKDIGIFVDPLNKEEIIEKIKWLSDESNYREQKKKIENFNFTHSWEEIADEYIKVFDDVK